MVSRSKILGQSHTINIPINILVTTKIGPNLHTVSTAVGSGEYDPHTDVPGYSPPQQKHPAERTRTLLSSVLKSIELRVVAETA